MAGREGELKARKPLLLCLGYGATARALGKALPDWRVAGTSRTPSQGMIVFSGNKTDALEAVLAQADALVCSIPPDANGCSAFRALEQNLRAPSSIWRGYLSTTGVYGDLAGRWAFEWSPRNPQSPEAARRALAEDQWLGAGAHVFRLPGLYGPGRSALDRVRARDARAIVKPGQVFSRAHYDDVASALALSIAKPNPGRVYNICDDEPAPPQDVIAYAARLLGVDPPREEVFEPENLSKQAQRFWSECKRVSNARAKAELAWSPLYPSYREGLRAIAEAGG